MKTDALDTVPVALPIDAVNAVLAAYWLQHYVDLDSGLCSLCAGRGVLHTAARSAAGVLVSGSNFCICPNGQAARHYGPPR